MSFGALSLRCHFLAARCPRPFAHEAHEIHEKEGPFAASKGRPKPPSLPPAMGSFLECADAHVWAFGGASSASPPEQSGVALGLPPQSKRDRRFLIIFMSFRVFRGQEFLKSTHVPVPDCDLAGAS